MPKEQLVVRLSGSSRFWRGIGGKACVALERTEVRPTPFHLLPLDVRRPP